MADREYAVSFRQIACGGSDDGALGHDQFAAGLDRLPHIVFADEVESGTGASQIADTLRQPVPFTDALLAPWRSDVPAAGDQRFTLIDANFLPATLIPTQVGGEAFNGTFFTDGSWTRLTSQALGPPLQDPVPALASRGAVG